MEYSEHKKTVYEGKLNYPGWDRDLDSQINLYSKRRTTTIPIKALSDQDYIRCLHIIFSWKTDNFHLWSLYSDFHISATETKE